MLFINRLKIIHFGLVFTLLLIASESLLSAENLKRIINAQEKLGRNALKSQKTIDVLADETQAMLSEYKLTLRQLESLKIYNSYLEEHVKSQKQELASVEEQLQQIDVTHREIVPLMVRMVDTLQQFVELDTPFLLSERRRRIVDLKAIMRSADVSISEKYRRVMEAYQVETEYGRTIEAYRDMLEENDLKRSVDFLRIGRIAFIYQTLDGKEAGIWDDATKTWAKLPNKYLASTRNGLRIARKQAAPDLLKLPIRAPVIILDSSVDRP